MNHTKFGPVNSGLFLATFSRVSTSKNRNEGSVYNETSMYENGMIGEYESDQSNNTIAVKYHGIKKLSTDLNASGVIMVVSYSDFQHNQMN